MGNHESLISDIEDGSIRFLQRVDELKLFLAFSQTAPTNLSGWSSEKRDARALAIICTVAELESLVRLTVRETHRELNMSAIECRKLIPSIRQVAAHTTFESLRNLNDPARLWEKRFYASTLEICSDIAQFPVEINRPQPPLDGKTLKPEHFYRLWSIYSLPGAEFPDPQWPGALQKLALARNDIAHGNLPYSEIFQQAGRSLSEIENYVNSVGDFTAHFIDTWCSYLKNRGYLIHP